MLNIGNSENTEHILVRAKWIGSEVEAVMPTEFVFEVC